MTVHLVLLVYSVFLVHWRLSEKAGRIFRAILSFSQPPLFLGSGVFWGPKLVMKEIFNRQTLLHTCSL